MKISLNLNGEQVYADVEADSLLLDTLRDQLGLTGTKEGCGVGVCGACSVLVGGNPVSSCLYLAAMADGADVWTVEGLTASDPDLADAFVECEGMQCGICTPGQVVAAAALRRHHPGASPEEIRRWMSGNLCRCTGYGTIIEAVERYVGRD
ncbi:MAG TPA: (2Fe-2S)-binding protein [Acidimicrobiales bacterium]|nr:(2Fe-2S)-binding protein [Acidimicrobiales bacterium]